MYRTKWLNGFSRVWLYGAVVFVVLGYSTQVGNYVSHTTDANTVTISTGGTQKVRITVCTPSIVRVEFDPRGILSDTLDLLNAEFMTKQWDPVVQPTVSDKGTTLEIETGKLVVQLQKSPLRIKYIEAGTLQVLTGEDNIRGMAVGQSENPWVQFTQRADEHYYGWGQAYGWYKAGFTSIDKKGLQLPLDQNWGMEAPFMYSTGGYGVFVLFACRDLNGTTGTGLSSVSPAYNLTGSYARYVPTVNYLPNMLCYYFIAGPSGSGSKDNWREVIDGYTRITGRPQLVGKKFYGIQRDIYLFGGVSVADVKAIADRWRSGRFPMDLVRNDEYFDWGKIAYDVPPNLSGWNAQVPEAVAYFKSKGFVFGGMVKGFGFDGCCGGRTDDVLVEDSTHAKIAVDHGFDFAWYDAMTVMSRSKAVRQFNVWKYAHNGDEARVWGPKGWWSICSQSFAGTHCGDDLQNPNYAVFPAHLEQSLAGYAFNLTDLGEGHDWNYIGTAMRPIAMYHQSGAAGGYRESDFKVYNYIPALQDLIRKWARLHYRFIPYFFTYGMIARETGMPIWRHMVCHDPHDTTGYRKDRQAYVGDNILISPYYGDGDANSGIRKGIYLPAGTWYDYFEGTSYTGPKSIDYAVDPHTGMLNYKLPMFVKAGSIIPLMDTLQYIGERADSLITVQIWPTAGTASPQQGAFTLYEDEGVWNVTAQTRTAPSTTALLYGFTDDGTSQQTTVTLGAFAGSRYCPQSKRIWRIEIHNVKKVTQVMSASTATWTTPITLAQYNAGQAGFCWDAGMGGVCYINAVGNAAAGFNVYASTGNIAVRPGTVAAAQLQRISIVRHAQSVRVSVPFAGEHVAEVINPQGRVITQRRWNGTTVCLISLHERVPGLCLLRVSAGGRTIVMKMMF